MIPTVLGECDYESVFHVSMCATYACIHLYIAPKPFSRSNGNATSKSILKYWGKDHLVQRGPTGIIAVFVTFLGRVLPVDCI